MNNEPFILKADIDLKQDFYVEIKCCQYDDVILQLNVYDAGKYLDLSDYTIEMDMLKPDKTIYHQNSMVTTSGNTVSMVCTEQFSVVGGNGTGSILLVEKDTGRKKYSFNFEIYIKPSPIADGVNSKSTITLLDQIQDALDELRDISVNLTEAVQVNSEMKSNIATGKTLNNDLSNNINAGSELNNDLIANTEKADTSNTILVNNTNTADNINDVLEKNIDTGKSVNTNMQNNITEGTALNNNLNEVKNIVESDIEEGKQVIEHLKKVNSDYTNHINDDKRHFSEGQKDAFLLLLENFDKLSSWVQELLGTGYLIDEQGNYIVDEQGNKFII